MSLYISNQNFHGCLDTSPKAYRLIMTNQHLMGPFHYQWFASKTFFTFCHRRSAFRMVSTFLTDDILFIKVGMLSLGVFAFVLPGNPETGEKWVRYCHLVLEM